MCGIVGYVGNEEATKILIEGLSKLEYRGYDSAGVAVLENGKINVRKSRFYQKTMTEPERSA